MPASEPFRLGRIRVAPGTRKDILLKVSEQPTAVPVHIPVTVLHGPARGPKLFVTAAVHGDELNGIEAVRRLRQAVDPARLRGTLVMVAVANPIGLMLQSRDLPDGRDLNRCFPGRRRGSIGAIVARTLFDKVVLGSDLGIDIHTAGRGRSNLPHIRADLRTRAVRELARAFGTAVVLHQVPGSGTLRWAAAGVGIPVVTFEAGEALRFEPEAIDASVQGVLRVLHDRAMLPGSCRKGARPQVFRDCRWVRARRGGILVLDVRPGDVVRKSQVLGFTSRPLGSRPAEIVAPFTGLVLSTAVHPTVLPGSAVCHLVPLNGAAPSALRRKLGGGHGSA